MVRGTYDRYEWLSNMDMNYRTKYHSGFVNAAVDIVSAYMSAIDRYGDQDGKIILWTTGHSRGAAISNYIAGAAGNGNRHYRVFSYNFACPAVTQLDTTTRAVIVNYNNANDVVPTLPLTAWNYHRYGKTITEKRGGVSADFMTWLEHGLLAVVPTSELAGNTVGRLALGSVGMLINNSDPDQPRLTLTDVASFALKKQYGKSIELGKLVYDVAENMLIDAFILDTASLTVDSRKGELRNLVESLIDVASLYGKFPELGLNFEKGHSMATYINWMKEKYPDSMTKHTNAK